MPTNHQVTKAAFSIPEVMESLSLGRTTIYEQIKAGNLRTLKVGRRTIVPANAVSEFLDKLEGGE
ncbi:MAG: excisionase family DNA binding protein [Paracoccaceae bacterium]|jgi:excisionase family DNA binding protein